MKKITSIIGIALLLLLSPQMAKAGKRAFVAEKNFPMVVALGDFVGNQNELITLAQQRMESVKAAEGALWLNNVKFSEEEIELLAGVVSAKGSHFAAEFKKKGCYYIYNNLPDKEFLKAALRQDLEGINRIIRVYGQGEKPVYAGIDSISFVVGPSGSINGILKDLKAVALKECNGNNIFEFPVCVALSLLEANDRMDAAAFEPMDEGINHKAALSCKETDWSRYEYSAILIPGCGPDIAGQSLSPTGRQRVRYAASLYKEGKAPFLIVSGGTVHPRLTIFNEAEQMRKYLIEECEVPEEAIFSEPHARHTTTNMRNAVRIMLRHGFPEDKPALVASSEGQISYIGKESFAEFCIKMMYVLPFRLAERINPNEWVFYPLPCAFQVCPADPMDP